MGIIGEIQKKAAKLYDDILIESFIKIESLSKTTLEDEDLKKEIKIFIDEEIQDKKKELNDLNFFYLNKIKPLESEENITEWINYIEQIRESREER